MSQNPHLRAFRSQLETAVAPPAIPEWEQLADAISTVIEPVMYGKLSAADGVRQMSEKVSLILQKPQKSADDLPFWVLLSFLGLLALLLLLAFFRYCPKKADYISPRRFQPVALFFVLPALVLLTAFLFIPIFVSWFTSFTNWDMYGISNPSNVVWIGLDNYRHLSTDPVFWISLRNSLIFACIGVPLNIACSLFIALLSNRKFIRFGGCFITQFQAKFSEKYSFKAED